MKTLTCLSPLLLIAGITVRNTAFSQTIAGGNQHSLSVCANGTVEAWGYNNYGQLGIGTTGFAEELSVTVSGLTNVTAVSGGYLYSLALKADGTVWAWGNNEAGQLGDGTYDVSLVPVQVSGLTGVTAISAGEHHAIALKNDGTVWAWGVNEHGEHGNGTAVFSSNVPVQTSITDVIAIAAGEGRSFAVKNDGTVWAWGDNDGRLGDGTTADTSLPVQVSGLTNVIGVATKYDHSLALKSDGTVWAWGVNDEGQLGDGTYDNSNVPVQANITGVAAVAVGYDHSRVLKGDGTVWGWGDNSTGQIGNGTMTDGSPIPIQASSLTGITGVACGEYHCLAVKNDGTAWGTGQNSHGQIGDNTFITDSIPLQVLSLCQVAGTAENGNLLSVTLYPNPAGDNLYILSEENIQRAVFINALGRSVELPLKNNAIDLAGLADGMYFLQLTTENNELIIKKFVKR